MTENAPKWSSSYITKFSLVLIVMREDLNKFIPDLHSLVHCKKRLAIFPTPAMMSLTKISLAGNNHIFPSQGEFAWLVTSWLGTGKSLTFFTV